VEYPSAMFLRRLALFTCGVLAFAGCSSDGGGDVVADGAQGDTANAGSVDVATFCAFAEEQNVLADDVDDPADDPDEVLENLQQWQAMAPAEVAGDITIVADAFEALAEFDENDPEGFGAAFALMIDPRFLGAVENIENFLVDECGFDPEDFEDDTDGFEFDGDMDSDFDFDGGFEWDGEIDFGADGDMVELDDLSDWLEANHADDSWLELVVSRFSVPGVIALSGEFDMDEALAACDAVSTYLDERDIDAQVEIDGGDGDDLMVDTSTGSCAPV